MNFRLKLCISVLLFSSFMLPGQPADTEIPDHDLWPRPEINPIPGKVRNLEQPVISLNGIWYVNTNPSDEFWKEQSDTNKWIKITLPSSINKQGVSVRRGREYAFRRNVMIPENFKDFRIILRFEGVTGTAKAWINGYFLKKHYGGYTVWTCDITDFVTPGKEAFLIVGVIDEEAGNSTSTFNYGGIIRNVKLMAVPEEHMTRFNIETDLDDEYKDAEMKIWTRVLFRQEQEVLAKVSLFDPSGKTVDLQDNEILLTKEHPEKIKLFRIENPVKWDAEHPELYTLRLELIKGNDATEILTKKVGFREVEIKGNRMLINGREVKLRGTGRFDSDPVFGRFLSDEQSLKEVRMLKEANLNFVRPSCYPATDAYIDACDSLGLYVQLENSVTFARGTQGDSSYTPEYMNQMAEMIEELRSHPSIIIYELANETVYGFNITKTYEYAKAEDPTRPVIYSWSQSIPEGTDWPYDIYSYHYPDWDDDLGSAGVSDFNSKPAGPLPEGMPVLHDEFAHGAAYYRESLARDPGIRNFWGESIKIFWERMFTTDGCLGGAMWAIIDENAFGPWVFEWGAIDLWRRKRPEYWHIKKAYSPIRISEKEYTNPGTGNSLYIPLKNWYDHTNLNEMEIEWKVNDNSGTFAGPDIQPHGEGTLEIPYRKWQNNDRLELKFTDQYNRLVDQFLLKISPDPITFLEPAGLPPAIEENKENITVLGEDFKIIFDKQDGLIESGTFNQRLLIKGGPCFHLTGGDKLEDWALKSIDVHKDKVETVVTIEGTNNPVEVVFEVRIDGTGLITTNYKILKFGVEAPEPRKIPWNDQDAGGFQEVGISYFLTSDIDQLEWNRNGLWTFYPEDHIGRNTGTAQRTFDGNKKIFGERPERLWAHDEKDFSVFGQYDFGGRGTNDFRSMKEYINYAYAVDSKEHAAIEVESQGSEAVRLEVKEDKHSVINRNGESLNLRGSWEIPRNFTSYFGSEEMMSTKEGDAIEFSFQGNGFAWIGTSFRDMSAANIYIDGKLVKEKLQFFSRGESMNSILYSIEGLDDGLHNVRIVAQRSVRANEGRKVVIPFGAIRILNDKRAGDVALIINNQWNYTKLGLGNYMKPPIYIGDGYSNSVRFRMVRKE